MALRCGCPAEGDETVFGPIHECAVDPDLHYFRDGIPVRAPRIPPSWMSMVPYSRPWETTLGPDEVCE